MPEVEYTNIIEQVLHNLRVCNKIDAHEEEEPRLVTRFEEELSKLGYALVKIIIDKD